jgi:hypothetical protein
MVTHIWLTAAANEYGWPRLLRLRVYYDGSSTPSVDAPVGDFFGVGHGFERDINSLMVRDRSSGRSRNCHWPMPFRRACRIAITNQGRRRVFNLYYHVDWRKLPSQPPNIAYFHALYRQALPAAAGKPYGSTSMAKRRLASKARAPRTTSTTLGPCVSRKAYTRACRWPKART